jgi:4'-phosphopantetheinyl transferase
MRESATRIRSQSFAAPGRDEVHLWLVRPREVTDGLLLQKYRSLLTEEERSEESRFHFEKHRSQYLITRALIRTVLSGYSGIEARSWRFATSAYGRPQIAGPNRLGGLAFNIGHTDELIVCACIKSGMIGVDTECLQGGNAPLEMAERHLSAAELAEFQSSGSKNGVERLLQYRTLKESYIKAVGAGLSIPLDQFSFNLARTGHIALSFDGSMVDAPEYWSCWLLRPMSGHIIAVCAERAIMSYRSIVARKVVPLFSEEPFQCEVIATSN